MSGIRWGQDTRRGDLGACPDQLQTPNLGKQRAQTLGGRAHARKPRAVLAEVLGRLCMQLQLLGEGIADYVDAAAIDNAIELSRHRAEGARQARRNRRCCRGVRQRAWLTQGGSVGELLCSRPPMMRTIAVSVDAPLRQW